MKTRVMFLLLSFLCVPAFAGPFPSGSQFHLTQGNAYTVNINSPMECQGSCLYMVTAVGAQLPVGLQINADGSGLDYIANELYYPLPDSTVKIGQANIYNTIYEIHTTLTTATDVVNVIPGGDCSDTTTKCTGDAVRAYPIYLVRATDNHQFIITATSTETSKPTWHYVEWKKQGDWIYARVTGYLLDYTCPTCGWPNRAAVEFRLQGHVTTHDNLIAINSLDGNVADLFITAHGDGFGATTGVRVNGVAAPYVVSNDHTMQVWKGANINMPVFIEVDTATGSTRWPEAAKVAP